MQQETRISRNVVQARNPQLFPVTFSAVRRKFNVKLCRRGAALIVLGGFLSLCAFSQNVSLEVQPTSIPASTSPFTAEARIILKNAGEEVLRGVSLVQFSNDGIKAELGKPTATVAAPKHTIVWPVKISGPGQAHFPGSIIFDAEYVTSSGIQHVYTPLSLQTDGVQKPAEASLEGNLDAISAQRPGAIYLLVTNNMDAPANVSITSQVPQSAIIVSPVSSFDVPPHSTAATRISVLAASRVQPGVYPVVIEAKAKWNWAGRTEERQFVLSKPATLGVFFESDLLKVLSVPSFLVLPGCLMVFAFQFLLSFNLLGLKDHSKLPDLTVTSPGFWLLAVTLSAVFAYVYYRWTGINCLLSYGVDDLRNVWVSSILIGFGIYLAIALFTRKWRSDHIPRSKDQPIDILHKLANNHLGILRPKVTYTLNSKELSGFLIEEIEDGQTLVWVAPGITTDWQDTPDAANLKTVFDTAINGDREAAPAALVDVLKRAGKLATADWNTDGVVPNPYHVKVEAITKYDAAEIIVT